MLFNQGKLEKLTLRAYKPAANPKDPPQVSTAPQDTYVVQVNPSSYSLAQTLSYSRNLGQGFSGSDAIYSYTPPETLDFEFLFDATGVVPAPSETGDIPLVGAVVSALSGSQPYVVMDEIKKFNTLVYDYSGDIHRPRRVLLVWGSLKFSCVLSSLVYRFTLFKQDGTPLRAVASCSFSESKPDSQRVREDNAHSPDLTHVRDVQDGDTLPLLAYDIYGDPNLYIQVAQVNKLVNFRRLKSATPLQFPPVDKTVSS